MDITKLSQIGQSLETLPRKKSRRRIRTNKEHPSRFSDALHRIIGESAPIVDIADYPVLDGTETLENLLDKVHETGALLKKDAVFGPLKEYKNAVRCFLRYILAQCYEVDEDIGIRNPQTMIQKKYLVVRSIDEKLEHLATHVLKSQSSQLDILRRVDEINGLLVDLSG